jgi:glycine hydroxymethyltransferase
MNAPHRDTGFFSEPLSSRDPELYGAVRRSWGGSATRSS